MCTAYPAPIPGILMAFAILGGLCLLTTISFVVWAGRRGRASGGEIPMRMVRYDNDPVVQISPGGFWVEEPPTRPAPESVPDKTAVANAFGIPEHLIDPPTRTMPVHVISHWRPMTDRQHADASELAASVTEYFDKAGWTIPPIPPKE